jgi:gamma-glutamyltranspeptidase/glutathione hydrolase
MGDSLLDYDPEGERSGPMIREVGARMERTEWLVDRAEASARGGMVAAKTGAAAEVGVAVLRRGGNAVDAAVATAFAAGVVEPWMNGIGGGGLMVVHQPGQEGQVVEFPMVAPAGATPEMFALSGAGADAALFGWAAVVDQANVVGHRAVAVPGTVAGLALALERFGSMGLDAAVAPAIQLAAEGTPVTWHTTLTVARDLGTLRRYPATAAVFLDGEGNPPVTAEQGSPVMLRQPDLAQTLEEIGRSGPRVFYEGALARAIVAHLVDAGAPFEESDFSGYEATIMTALEASYRGHQVLTSGGGTGGTTLVESLHLLDALDVASLDWNTAAALHRMTQAFRQAFADRFAYLADSQFVEVPVATLTDPDYARERAATFADDRLGAVAPGAPDRLGVAHGLAASMPDYVGDSHQAVSGSTTHLSVIDRDGMAVSLTQTLLSLWGSRVVAPGTGVLLNNGMMWFDPEPGRPNSVAGGKRPLSNMAPVVVTRDGCAVASLGASGGRRIMNCNAQLVMNLVDQQQSMQSAISAPRIDASTSDLLVSARLPEVIRSELSRLGHRVAVRDECLFTGDFASPVGIVLSDDGVLHGGADPYYAPATAAGVERT